MTFFGAVLLSLPERGRIGINKSYHEEALVVRVHPEYLGAQNLPDTAGDPATHRFNDK